MYLNLAFQVIKGVGLTACSANQSITWLAKGLTMHRYIKEGLWQSTVLTGSMKHGHVPRCCIVQDNNQRNHDATTCTKNLHLMPLIIVVLT